MAECLKLIIEKGPREGETLNYSSGSTVKVGRVVRGNTIAIKDVGISSKHISIQFDNHLSKWTLIDLDSSNGTILNGKTLKPYVPSALDDADCIKIGELTSIIVKIGVESPIIQARRNLRRQGKPPAAAELELGLDAENEVQEKPNLRTRVKKGVDLKNEVEIRSSKRRLLRSSKNEEVSFIPDLTNESISIEPRRTRGRKKLPVQLPEDPDGLDKGKRAAIDESCLKGKEVAEELECIRKDGCEGIVKDAGPDDNGQWLDLEKMTLSDFFDYLEVQLPKEIYDKSEKIISNLKEKSHKCHEFMLQRNESGNGQKWFRMTKSIIRSSYSL